MLTIDQLAEACNFPRAWAETWHPFVVAGLVYAQAESPQQQAMWLATCGHESAGFSSLEESFNYSPEGLLATWPSRFDVNLARKLGRCDGHRADRVAIAEHVYGGRMDNDNPGDGWKYRGRGLIQLTGRVNYAAAGDALGVDYLANPDLVATPQHGALTSGWFWKAHNLHRLEKLLTVSRIVNIGNSKTRKMPHGWDDRRKRYDRAMQVLSKPQSASERAQRLLSQ